MLVENTIWSPVYVALGGNLVSEVDLDSATAGEQSLAASSVGWLTIHGGDGNDWLDASMLSLGLSMYGNGGNDTLLTGSGNDYAEGGAGDDRIEGNSGNDQLYGDWNDPWWSPSVSTGNDTIWAGAGDDNVWGDAYSGGGTGNDVIDGGEGNDYLHGAGGGNIIRGGTGSDVFALHIAATTTVYTGTTLRLDGVDYDFADLEGGRLDANNDANSIDFSLFAGNLSMYGNGGMTRC